MPRDCWPDAAEDLPHALSDLAIAYLRLICEGEIVACRRMIVAEGAKSSLGRLFFENGPKRSWSKLAETFRRAMEEGRMRPADPAGLQPFPDGAPAALRAQAYSA